MIDALDENKGHGLFIKLQTELQQKKCFPEKSSNNAVLKMNKSEQRS